MTTKKITYVVVVTSSSIQKIHSLVVVEDLVVVEVVVVVEAVVGAGVTGVPVVVSNKNSSRSTALSVTSSNSIVLSSVVFSSIISISELFSDEFVIRGVAVVEIVVWDLGEMDFEVVIGTNSPITIVGCISVKVLKKSVCVFVCFMLKIIISTHKFIFIPRSAPFFAFQSGFITLNIILYVKENNFELSIIFLHETDRGTSMNDVRF